MSEKASFHGGESPLYEELRVVRDGVEEVLGVLTFMARDPLAVERRLDEVHRVFRKGGRMVDVYLTLNRDRNISEVGQVLGMPRQNVWRAINQLRESHLIVPHSASGRGDVWIPNPTLETVLHLSHRLREWFPRYRPAAAASDGG